MVGIEILTDWVVEYFTPTCKGATIHDALRDASPVVDTDKMPLILQDRRHSRTIVGYEVSRDGTVNLLMFDPALLVLIVSPLFTLTNINYSIPDRSLRNLALSSLTLSAHKASSVSSDQSICASPNTIQHDTSKRPSGTWLLSTHDENHAKRTRRFSHPDGQISGDEPLQGRLEMPGHAVESSIGLSRRQFGHFRLSSKRLKFVFRGLAFITDTESTLQQTEIPDPVFPNVRPSE